MKVITKRPQELSDAEIAAWRRMRDLNPAYRSPYFTYEFARAVGENVADARIAIGYAHGEPIAFLGVQGAFAGYARPIGGPLSDFHAPLYDHDKPFDFTAFMAAARIGIYAYRFAPAEVACMHASADKRLGSHTIDLSEGAEAYEAERRASKPNLFKSLPRKTRKLERELGELRFVLDDRAPEAFETMLRWKAEQYVRTGHFNAFELEWPRAVLESIWNVGAPDLKGLLSSLYAGDRLIAAHFGMVSGSVWHYWFPVYEHSLSKFSAGHVMMMKMVEACDAMGVREIHLGAGDSRHKLEFANMQIPIVWGRASAPSMTSRAIKFARGLESAFARLPAASLADAPGRLFRKIDRMLEFRVN